MEDDLYVLLVDWQPLSTAGATFKIYHNPLVNWLWFGGFVFILGTLVAAWPDKEPIIVISKPPVGGKVLVHDLQSAPAFIFPYFWVYLHWSWICNLPSDDEVNAIAQLYCPV
jgi:hypothetical protein